MEWKQLDRMIRVETSGDTKKTEAFLTKMMTDSPYENVKRLAQKGVDALASVTPRDTGNTAAQWSYEIVQNGSSFTIHWLNDNVQAGFNVAIGLQYGHGTGTGGYIQGRDYINPALRPIFDQIAADVWKEVQRS